MNPYMYIYALSVAILHRPDTRRLQIPSLAEVFPDKYMDGAVFAKAKEESNIVPEEQRVTTQFIYIARVPRHLISYFFIWI